MRCSGCGFHNLPGTTACVSCGSLLATSRSGQSVGVLTPPRATPLRKWWQQRSGRLRLFITRHSRGHTRWMRYAGQGVDLAVRSPRLAPHLWVALWGLVPGLPQYLRGESFPAAVFAGSWLALVFAAAFFFAHPVGTVFLALAIGWHALSALMPYRGALSTERLLVRCALSLAAYAAIVFCVYFPLEKLVGYFLVPLATEGTTVAGQFADGDTLLVRRIHDPEWLPRVGTLVAVERPSRRGSRTVIDRVVAGPGDHLAFKKGVLSRNGEPAQEWEYPLDASMLPPELDLTVPAGKLFVWPSIVMQIRGRERLRPVEWANMVEAAQVPRADWIGVPWMVYHPISRRRFLNP